jgi:two-component system sensor histidine kinase GlrK
LTSAPRIRFPIFTRIIAGFVGVIIILVTLALGTLLQLRPVENRPELRITPHVITMETLWKIQKEASLRYFASRSSADEQKLVLVESQVRSAVDSLEHMLVSLNDKQFLNVIPPEYARFDDFLKRQPKLSKENPAYDVMAAWEGQRPLLDSLERHLAALKDAYLPNLIKSIDRFNRDRQNAITTGYLILLLGLAISSVIGLFVARRVTRPIQALKAGTQRVSEAQYENVPITSNDEIADLTNAFNTMSAKLKQLDEMRMALMSEISHEMRTPLQVIKAGCYSVIHARDGASLNQRQRDAVGMIHQATNRINQFVNLFLDIAKLEAGLMKFSFQSTNLVDLLSPLIQEAELIGQTRQITIGFTADQLPPLMIDKDRLSQVFSNLLSNALKYTPDHGAITVTIVKTSDCGPVGKEGRGCVRIDVQDSGVGIPESDLSKLFNKFYQAKNVPLVNEKGSGLGLALVKHVTEAHGGQVSVKSQVGVGSTFTVLLPC